MFAPNSATMATSLEKSQKIQTISSCKLILKQKIDCGFITETVSNIVCYIDVKKKISMKKYGEFWNVQRVHSYKKCHITLLLLSNKIEYINFFFILLQVKNIESE